MTTDAARLLRPYVPIDRRRAASVSREGTDRTEGAALFADLSGFTRLTQALASAYGPYRGAEELTGYLARAYEALIGAVHAEHGATVGFSGDAVTCWFEGDDGRAAVRAGFAMQHALAELPPALAGRPEEVQLAVKVAVVHGRARRFLVGDPSIQRIDVLAGHTLDRLAACERSTRPGEVVVDLHLRNALDLPSRTERRDEATGLHVAVLDAPASTPTPLQYEPAAGPDPTGDPSVDSAEDSVADDAADAAWAATWVLPAVRERMLAGAHLLAADFRPAAALFLAFRGIDYDDDEGAAGKLDAFVRWVQRVVEDLEGALVQLTFGDKGSYLYCTFGAPVAHDDDAVRAVAAAEILRSPPQPYVREVKIGVTYGRMYAGAYGSSERCTYGVLGPKTNLAARLMTAAEPGGILCDADLVQQARRRWRFRALPPIRVKNVDGPVEVFTPDGRAPSAELAAAEVVGRQAELLALRDALDDLTEGHPHVVTVSGPAGIGKSRLLDALARMGAERGVQVATAGEHAWGRDVPYRPWRPIVRRLLDLEDDLDPEALTERVAAFAPDVTEWAPLLGDVFGVEVPATDLTRDLAPETRSRNRVHLLTELMRARTRTAPWIFLLDEAQHLDSVSWDLAAAMARVARDDALPLGLVFAYRPHELSPLAIGGLERVLASGPSHALELGELEPAEVEELLTARFALPPNGVADDLLAFVATRASGNPFFAEELVQMLLEDGTIWRRPDGGWELAHAARARGGGSGIPSSLHGLVLARIDRVPAASGRALKVASVIGRSFGADLLRAATGDDADGGRSDPVAHLGALVSRDLIAPTEPDTYRFLHVTVHQVAYESLLFAQRRRLHAAIAAWHERNGDLSETERTALLAHHYARAAAGSGDDALVDRAGELLAVAAAHNERVSAFAEAAASYRIALDLFEERSVPSERAEGLRVRLGDMHERLGEYEPAEACFQEALRRAPDAATEAAAMASLCLLLTRKGEYGDARSMGERAMEAASAAGDRSLLALVRGRMGILAALGGDLAEAEALFEAAYRHYLETGQTRNAAAWLNNIGLGLVFQERFDEAAERLTEALDLSRSERIREIEAQVLMNLGLCAHKQGDLERAAERYRTSLEISRTLLAREDALINAVNLGDVALARGHAHEAWHDFVRAAEEAVAFGAMPRTLDALRGAAEVLASLGEHERAAEIVGFILAHPACNVEVRGEVERVVTTLTASLDGAALGRARTRGREQPIDEVLVALRTIPPRPGGPAR